jgi:uncharacterized membrane protein HdeD (DUF308 family)
MLGSPGWRIAKQSEIGAIVTNQQSSMAQPAHTRAVGRHRTLYLIEGIILVLLGLLAVFMPPAVGIALFGWLFLTGGIVGLITTLMMWRRPGFWWSLLSAISTIAVGGLVFAVPELGLVTLPFLLVAFLGLEGIVTIMLALDHWRELSGRWSWMLASGVVDLAMAAVIVIGLPTTSTWAIGLAVAVNLLCGGAAMIGMALAATPGRARSTATAAKSGQSHYN